MTKGLANSLGIPTLEEIMKETEAETEQNEQDEQEVTENLPVEAPSSANDLISHHELKAASHGKAMDKVHDEVLDHARQVAELGFDLDPARAPRMFEVANQLYKTAIDAKSSKRDAELKLFKLIQDQKRLELEERKFRAETGQIESSEASVVVVEDRNVLLARLREEAKKKNQE